jgi:hypothetical protein
VGLPARAARAALEAEGSARLLISGDPLPSMLAPKRPNQRGHAADNCCHSEQEIDVVHKLLPQEPSHVHILFQHCKWKHISAMFHGASAGQRLFTP